MLKNRKIKIFTFNLTQFDNAMLLRVDEAGEKVHGIQHPQIDPRTTLGTLKGAAEHRLGCL